MTNRMLHRSRFGRFRSDEKGEFLGFLIVMITAVLLVVGFTVDASRLLTARRDLNDTASQAALAAAQQVDGGSILRGEVALGANAIEAGHAYLAAQGVTGTVAIVGDTAVVEVTGTVEPIMFVGFGARTVTAEATARAVRGIDQADT